MNVYKLASLLMYPYNSNSFYLGQRRRGAAFPQRLFRLVKPSFFSSLLLATFLSPNYLRTVSRECRQTLFLKAVQPLVFSFTAEPPAAPNFLPTYFSNLSLFHGTTFPFSLFFGYVDIHSEIIRALTVTEAFILTLYHIIAISHFSFKSTRSLK
jgi:hypothetical protein